MYDPFLNRLRSSKVTAKALGSAIAVATTKSNPVDTDSVALSDSAASNILKKWTFVAMKAALKSYFDSIYAPKP